ncbi:MAG: phosphatase PAP2 family protein [Candidatus Doudnabacteria bacterium]|nr:phosphatase PAP2 family protein [Candidatus Doudnabacteria bacterium]
MNYQIFYAINGLAGRYAILDALGIFFADYFVYVSAGLLLLLWFNKQMRSYVTLAFAAAFFSRVVVVELIKRLLNHPRPHEVLMNIHQLLADSENGRSFPSGHAVMYFSLAFAFWGTKYFWPFSILALLGSLARIYVGVHFPIDILGSFIIAILTVALFRRLFKKRISG